MHGLQCWQSHEIKYDITIPNLNYSKIRCEGWQSLRASNMKPHFPNSFDVMDRNMIYFKLTPLATRFLSNRLFRQSTKKAPKHCSSAPGNPLVTGGFRPLRPVVQTASLYDIFKKYGNLSIKCCAMTHIIVKIWCHLLSRVWSYVWLNHLKWFEVHQ